MRHAGFALAAVMAVIAAGEASAACVLEGISVAGGRVAVLDLP